MFETVDKYGRNERQQALYLFTATLYAPTVVAFVRALTGGFADAMTDISYNASPVATDVFCYFKAAAEVASGTPEGLQAEANLFTYYIFDFVAGTQIDNTYAIQLTTPGPNYLDWFYVTDVSKSTISSGQRSVNRSQVYAKRGDKPNGVS